MKAAFRWHTRDARRWLVDHSFSVFVLLAIAAAAFAVMDVSYQNRKSDALQVAHAARVQQIAQHGDDVASCHRAVKNTGDNANFDYAAYVARIKESENRKVGAATRRDDRTAALVYLSIAEDLNTRTYDGYSVTSPYVKPSAPKSVRRHYPLGEGRLSCERVYPLKPAAPPAHVSFF